MLRLHRSLADASPRGERIRLILDLAGDFDVLQKAQLAGVLRESAKDLPEVDPEFRTKLEYFGANTNRFVSEPYPDHSGVVLMARTRIDDLKFRLPAIDDGEDDSSRLGREKPVTLADHTAHVVGAIKRVLKSVHTSAGEEVYSIAANLHDWGKADDRFQVLLRGTDRTDAWLTVRPSASALTCQVRRHAAESWRAARPPTHALAFLPDSATRCCLYSSRSEPEFRSASPRSAT